MIRIERKISCVHGPVGLALTLLVVLPRLLAFDIKVFPASEVYDPDVEYFHERLGIKGQAMKVEEFEGEQLESWLRTNLKPGGEETKPSAWVGNRASAASDVGEFEISLPKVRVFGIGLGDNDGGNEQISVNGNPPLELKRFPGHEGNGIGRAFYVLVFAEPNDADIHTVMIDRCMTVNFDHLVVLENKELPPLEKLAPRVALQLRDGTRLVGDTVQDSIDLSVKTEKVDLRFDRIFSMQFQSGTSNATILLKSGEKLSCELGWPVLKVRTIVEEISVPREMIRQLKVMPRGEFSPEDARSERLKHAFHADEPSYEGKSLRQWLSACHPKMGIGKAYDLFNPDLDTESAEQRAAKTAIRKIGTAAIPFLVELVSREGLDSRMAVQGFAALGSLAKPAVPDLLLLLEEPVDAVQYSSIAWSIGQIGPAASSAIPVLLKGESRYPMVAAEALGNIGPTAEEAVPILIAKISAGDLPYDLPLIIALGQIGSSEALPLLLSIAQEPDSRRNPNEPWITSALRRHRAVEALGKIGPTAETAVPGLIALLKTRSSADFCGHYFSERILRTLGSIGPNAREAIPVLNEIARESNQSRISQSAALALAKIQEK